MGGPGPRRKDGKDGKESANKEFQYRISRLVPL